MTFPAFLQVKDESQNAGVNTLHVLHTTTLVRVSDVSDHVTKDRHVFLLSVVRKTRSQTHSPIPTFQVQLHQWNMYSAV